MSDQVLATVGSSPGRRFLGVGSLWFLALLVLYVAIATPPALGWQVFLIFFGLGAMYIGELMRRVTAVHLELTETELRDTLGNVIARVEDIESIDRGMFAFKPSNGFLVRTSSAGDRAWYPGVWWRLGRRIGVGGMTPAAQAKAMSEILSAILARRDFTTD